MLKTFAKSRSLLDYLYQEDLSSTFYLVPRGELALIKHVTLVQPTLFSVNESLFLPLSFFRHDALRPII